MKALLTIMAAVLLVGLGAAPATALSTEEIIKLKKAGVSDATIEKMLEQERQRGPTQYGPVTETDDQIIYRAGPGAADARRHERREREKERQSMDILRGGVIVDQRGRPAQPGGATTGGGQGGGQGGQ